MTPPRTPRPRPRRLVELARRCRWCGEWTLLDDLCDWCEEHPDIARPNTVAS